MPDFLIREDAFARFPTLRVLTLDVEDLPSLVQHSPVDPSSDCLARLKEGPTSALPEIKDWREAFRVMGLQPTKTLSSVEALIRRAAKDDGEWRTGIAAVDFYNAISIQHVATLGAYDRDCLGNATITIRELDPLVDRFNPIGQSRHFPFTSQILAYARNHEVVCWALNHRDSIDFQISDQTTRATFVTETISNVQFSASMSAISAIVAAAEASGVRYGSPRLHDAEAPRGRPIPC